MNAAAAHNHDWTHTNAGILHTSLWLCACGATYDGAKISPGVFTVFLTNFGYSLDGSWSTLEAAKEAGRKAGFEFTVRCNGGAVGAWSVFGGWRNL